MIFFLFFSFKLIFFPLFIFFFFLSPPGSCPSRLAVCPPLLVVVYLRLITAGNSRPARRLQELIKRAICRADYRVWEQGAGSEPLPRAGPSAFGVRGEPRPPSFAAGGMLLTSPRCYGDRAGWEMLPPWQRASDGFGFAGAPPDSLPSLLG